MQNSDGLVSVTLNSYSTRPNEAKNLLELELDRGANLHELVAQIFGVQDGSREFAS
jgi:hypothetical protein